MTTVRSDDTRAAHVDAFEVDQDETRTATTAKDDWGVSDPRSNPPWGEVGRSKMRVAHAPVPSCDCSVL